MNEALDILQVARVTIEAKGPLSIAGDLADPEVDAAVERDANGLPAIPGTSLAGSLRHLRELEFKVGPDDKYCRLFGWTTDDIRDIGPDEAKEAASTYQASRLHITWAHIHDAENRPVDGLVTRQERLHDDPILGPMLDPVPARRDHVALDVRGVATKRQKFDRSYVPPGYRFTFELRLWTDDKRAEDEWAEIKRLLTSPFWRLGGATRRGYGKIAVIRLAEGCFKLNDAESYRRFKCHHPRLDETSPVLCDDDFEPDAADDEATLELVPDTFIRFGQGDKLLGEHDWRDAERSVDMLVVTMPQVNWSGDRATLESHRHLLVPASAIKGAIAHRCRFHLLAAARGFADELPEEASPEDRDRLAGTVDQLHEAVFGSANDDQDGKPIGRAGRLYLDDQLIPLGGAEKKQLTLQAHNSIDRFSGGVRKKVLFSEELLFRPKLAVPIRIDPPSDLTDEERHHLKACLSRSLADLCEGRLALGAGGSKGHGYCTGEVKAAGATARTWLLGGAP